MTDDYSDSLREARVFDSAIRTAAAMLAGETTIGPEFEMWAWNYVAGHEYRGERYAALDGILAAVEDFREYNGMEECPRCKSSICLCL